MRMLKFLQMVSCSAVLVLAGCAAGTPARQREVQPVRAYIVHYGQAAFERLARDFERETGTPVQITFECRRSLFGLVTRNRDGDLYIGSQDESFKQAATEGLAAAPAVQIGELRPVIEVVKGNPKKIQTLEDLVRPDVRVTLADEKSCVGQDVAALLAKNNLADKIGPRAVARVSGGEANVAKSVGSQADATIIWLCTLLETPGVEAEAVAIPPERCVGGTIRAVVLTTGKNRAGAGRFLGFLQSREAQSVLAEVGLARLSRPGRAASR
jgi:molybdate transport system substrate-binding protein